MQTGGEDILGFPRPDTPEGVKTRSWLVAGISGQMDVGSSPA